MEICTTSNAIAKYGSDFYAAGERDFNGINLYGANLTGVDLSKTSINLSGGIDNPRIAGAILCDTTLPDGGN